MHKEETQTGLKAGILLIFTANVINAIFTVLTNFLLPKYLTIEAYSVIKSYQLYLSYVGILHLGYSDGVYLKYGGKKVREISNRELASDISTFRVFQLVVSIVSIAISLLINDSALVACALAILPYNISNYYRSMFQAVGEFKRYSRIMNLTVILTFLANAILLLLHVFSTPEIYLMLYVAVNISIWIVLEVIGIKITSCGVKTYFFSIEGFRIIDNIRDGILLMLGTFSSIILTGMDRWFIKILMDNTAFALYSFAVSIEGIMSIATTPLSTTLYNYFCNHKDDDSIRRVKGYIVIIAIGIITCAFPAKIIVQIFIPNYMDSLSVLFILFGGQLFFIIVKSVYVNIYKAYKKQKLYFIKLVVVIVSGAVFNAGLYYILKCKEAFALGTMLCGVEWMILSIKDFRDKKTDIKYLFTCVFEVAAFILCGILLNPFIGLALYGVSVALVYSTILNSEFKSFFNALIYAGNIQKMIGR